MKQRNPYFLIIGILILFCSVLTVAMQKSYGTKMNIESVSKISQDCSLLGDYGVPDLNSENSETQIREIRQEITLPARSLNNSEFTTTNFFNKYIQNQISTPVIREFIANNRNSLIFTGELLI